MNDLWWHGPQWLSSTSDQWPNLIVNTVSDVPELKQVHLTTTDKSDDFTLRFSKLGKLVRVIAYCKRFIHNLRNRKCKLTTEPFSANELDESLMSCVKFVQLTYKGEIQDLNNKLEISKRSNLKSLHPFLDKQGFLRVGGRLQQSALPYQTIHQLILPNHHHFTTLLVNAEHNKLHHAGSQLLISQLRQRFWIPSIKLLVKSVIQQCLICYRLKAQASQQLMGELPAPMTQVSRPFRTVGVDYAGPVLLRPGTPRSRMTIKGYIAVFV
jgi:hypothetical protein